MSVITNIEWCDHTWSPWLGCRRVSEGCIYCYMLEMLKRWGKDGAKRTRTSESYWKQPLKWNRQAEFLMAEAAAEVYDIGGTDYHPPRVFPSLCDWLDNEVPIEWLADFLKLIQQTPNLDWLLLTKRLENAESRINAAIKLFNAGQSLWTLGGLVPHNVQNGVSVENQKRAEERIPELLKFPAKVRFLSCEPLLEAIRFDPHWLGAGGRSGRNYDQPQIDWVIVGGESGPKRRDCGVDAIVDVAEQCLAANVPVFVKQDCALRPGQQGRIPAHIWKLKQFPKV